MDPGKRKGVEATASTMLILPTLAIGLRCLAIMVVRKKKFGWDDYLAIADLPIIIAIAAITLAMVTFDEAGGFSGPPAGIPAGITPGHPPPGIPSKFAIGLPKKMENMVIAIQFLYLFGLSLPRLSLVAFYYKIFGKSKPWFINGLYLTGAISVLWLIINIIVTSVRCIPLQAQFAFGPFAHGKCINGFAHGISLLATSIFIDLMLLLLPMPLIFNIKTTMTKRITVALIFLCGGSVIIFTTGRLILTVQGGPFGAAVGFEKGGATAAFIQLEAAMSLVTVSLPTIFTLFRHLYSKKFKQLKSSPATTKTSPSDDHDHRRMIDARRLGAQNGVAQSSKTPLVGQNTTVDSITRPITTFSSWSSFDGDDLEKMALPVMPYQIMVKQDYYVRPGDFRL